MDDFLETMRGIFADGGGQFVDGMLRRGADIQTNGEAMRAGRERMEAMSAELKAAGERFRAEGEARQRRKEASATETDPDGDAIFGKPKEKEKNRKGWWK